MHVAMIDVIRAGGDASEYHLNHCTWREEDLILTPKPLSGFLTAHTVEKLLCTRGFKISSTLI